MTAMSNEDSDGEPIPWGQRMFDRIWLLAGAALVYFTLSYIVWGLIDLMAVKMG